MSLYGPHRQPIFKSDGSQDIGVAGTAVVYTRAFDLNMGVFFGIRYRAVSATAATDIKVELEQSDQLPVTEGSTDANWVVPSGASALEANLTSEIWVEKTLSPIPKRFGRLKLTGQGTNNADTIFNAFLSKVEED